MGNKEKYENTDNASEEMMKPDPKATIEGELRKEVEELKMELEEVKKSEQTYRNDYFSELAKRQKYEFAFKALVEELTHQIKK